MKLYAKILVVLHIIIKPTKGAVMPTFKDVVNFLNDRADVANPLFFSNPVSEMKTLNLKTPAPKFTSLATEGATD